jgi:hypothetical protein
MGERKHWPLFNETDVFGIDGRPVIACEMAGETYRGFPLLIEARRPLSPARVCSSI